MVKKEKGKAMEKAERGQRTSASRSRATYAKI